MIAAVASIIEPYPFASLRMAAMVQTLADREHPLDPQTLRGTSLAFSISWSIWAIGEVLRCKSATASETSNLRRKIQFKHTLWANLYAEMIRAERLL